MFTYRRVFGFLLVGLLAGGTPALAQAPTAEAIGATAPVTTQVPQDDARSRLAATTQEARRLVDALSARPLDRAAIDQALRSYEAAVVAFDDVLTRGNVQVGRFAQEPRRLLTKARAAARPRRGEENAARARFVSEYNGYLAEARAVAMMIGR